MDELTPLAPKYRYFTVDLLTNKILAEIPFRGVAWERALKGAGAFSGQIPVIPVNKHLSLYDTTMPGKTALFVVRNNICVWGGIIWSREYNVIDHNLSISASEFTSYFYHRKIWKTWNHQFGATVTIAAGTGVVSFDYGSNTTVYPGSSVNIEFYNPSDFKYNGYYRVESSPAPTLSGFSVVGGQSVADIASVEVISNVAYITTGTKHGFNTGDLITVASSYGTPFSGTFEITVPAGSETNLFTFPVSSGNIARTVSTGTSVRPVPAGVYLKATITVRSDTYDYIRTLIDSVFSDFVGTEFPNVYIEPGISYALNITNKQLAGGYATITTDAPHNLAIGQAVQVQDVGLNFDGEFEVLQTPANNVFMYAAGGTLASTTVLPFKATITNIALANGVVTINTASPHALIVGNNINVFVGYDFPALNGDQTVASVPSSTTYTYNVLSSQSIASKLLTNATVSGASTAFSVVSSKILGGTVTLTTAADHGFTVGTLVDIDEVNRTVFLTQKALDAPNSVATYRTATPHRLQTSTSTVQFTNLLNNPSGRRSIAGYLAINGTLGLDVGTDAYVIANAAVNPANVLLRLQRFTIGIDISASTTYTFSGNIYGSRGAKMSVSGTGVPVAVNGLNFPAGGLFYSTVIFTTGTSGTVDIYATNSTTSVVGDVVAFQDAMVEIGTKAHSYFDGSYGNTRNKTMAWTGTADSSTSTSSYRNTPLIEGLSDVSKLVSLTSTTSATTFSTEQAHNFSIGQSVTIDNLLDVYLPSLKAITSNVATLTTPVAHNVSAGTLITVSGLVDDYDVNSKMLSSGVATLGTSIVHNVKVNDKITVTGLSDSGTVVSKTAEKNIAILTLSAAHNFLEAQKITVSGVGAPFDGSFSVLASTDTRVFYEIDNNNAIILPARSSGSVISADSYFNGDWAVSAVATNSISFSRGGQDITSQGASGVLSNSSFINGVQRVFSTTSTTLSYNLVANNSPSASIPIAASEDQVQGTVSLISIFTGVKTLTGVSRNTITFARTTTNAIAPIKVFGAASATSIFNGSRSITSTPSVDVFKQSLVAKSNVLEESATHLATATAYNIFNGTYTITAVDAVNRKFSYARSWINIPETPVQSYGTSTKYPVAIVSSFGPYPGNSNIGMNFSTRKYSGVSVEPTAYRGFELKSVGEALDSYSDSLDGFEYRIDCSYDLDTASFVKTFVLIPINFPNPPVAGGVSPLSRFGADKFIFEYPNGSITAMNIAESAENSATRFFATGSTDLGPDAGPNISIASAEELLSGTNGVDSYRRWPLLDEAEKIDSVDDKTVLYAYAQRYLAENRPPDAKLTIEVNGSLSPIVGTYSPGDWCALIIKDDFVLMRLASDLEPRDDVLVRKIDGYKVSVPDGTTFPEKVSLTLVPEWEVDKIGKPSI